MKYLAEFALWGWVGAWLGAKGYHAGTKEFWIFMIPFGFLLFIRDTFGL